MINRKPLMAALGALCLVLAVTLIFCLPADIALAATLDGAAHAGSIDLSSGASAVMFAGPIVPAAIAQLQQRRAQLLDDMDKLAKAEQTDETRSKFDKLEADVTALDKDIERAKRNDELQRSRAADQVPPDGPGGEDDVERRAQFPAAPAERMSPDRAVGAIVRCYALSQIQLRDQGQYVAPAKIAEGLYGERAEMTRAVSQAQTLSSNVAGGFLVPPTYASEIIERFGPNTVMRKRCQVVPTDAIYLKGKSGVIVGYVGENEQGNVTKVDFGLVQMGERDISAILPISKKLLSKSAFNVESHCSGELTRGCGEFEDLMLLRGDGVGKRIKGLLYAVPKANKMKVADKSSPTPKEVRVELSKVLLRLANANVPMLNGAWLMAPRVLVYLQNLYTESGELLAFPSLQGPNPTLMGYPVDTTTQIPVNLGAGSNESEIYFGAFGYAMLGDGASIALSTSDQASIKMPDGSQLNLWSQGMMAIKVDMSHDFALKQDDAFAVLEAVKWGADLAA